MRGLDEQERVRRVGQNEAFFRQVNERVREVNETFSVLTGSGDFVCECGDPSCVDRIELTMEEYRRVRSQPELFAIRPGHEIADVETVVEENERFAVVRKREGEPSRVARELA